MNPTRRTLIFVAVAVVSVGVAAIAHQLTKPPKIEGYERVGEPFYPEFDDPNEATALRVVDYNEETASANIFNVEYTNGAWRIPSHHNYPAEGTEQLAKTAASVIGIERGALASRRKSDHERFGVVDPLDDTTTTLTGRGQRLTLYKGDGIVLADFIIGKQVEGEENVYYVRREDEDEVYRTQLEIDLSTKFSDWIEPDLLKLQRNDLIAMIINNYSIDPNRGAIQRRDVTRLTRESSSESWTLEGLDEKSEEVDTDRVSGLVGNLDNLKIVGVRPKPKGLTPDLTLDPEAVQDPRMERVLLGELQSKGFFVAEGEAGQRRLYSKEGELTAATNQGVVYHLNFGNTFTGSQEEIEIGGATGKGESAGGEEANQTSNTEGAEIGSNAKGEEPTESESEDQADTPKPGRYLFVRVEFDDKYLGPKPEKPVEPEKPKGLEEAGEKPSGEKAPSNSENGAEENDNSDSSDGETDADAGSQETGAGGNSESEANDQQTDRDQPDESDEASDSEDSAPQKQDETQDDESPEENEAPEKKDPKAEYEQAMKEYEQALQQYEQDLDDWEQSRDDGKEKVEELNRRFGEWYYVISGESFEDLSLSRAELVKPKEEDEGESEQDQAPDAGQVTPSTNPLQSPPGAAKPKTDEAPRSN